MGLDDSWSELSVRGESESFRGRIERQGSNWPDCESDINKIILFWFKELILFLQRIYLRLVLENIN